MFTYEISGENYIPHDNKLYKMLETIHNIEEIDEDSVYFHEDSIGSFEIPESYNSFDAIFTPFKGSKSLYYTIEDTGNLGSDFNKAVKLQSIRPNQIRACPQCEDGWAGRVGDDNQMCFECGWSNENETKD